MTFLEIMVACLGLFVVMPHVFKKHGINNVIFPFYIIVGLLLSPLLDTGTKETISTLAQAGFVLLLFSVGLEIKLPRTAQFLPATARALAVYGVCAAVVFILASTAGLNIKQALIAAAALSGVSLGLVHSALKETFEKHPTALHLFISLEVVTIGFLSIAGTTLTDGLTWGLLLKLLGVIVVIYILSRVARKLGHTLANVLNQAIDHRAHWLLFAIFFVAVLGERFGLSAPKTAFFLGLFITYTSSFARLAKTAIVPIGEKFLIPIFILSLGLQIDWKTLDLQILWQAAASAAVLMGMRYFVFKYGLKQTLPVSIASSANLTMVAISLELMYKFFGHGHAAAWILLTGLFMTIGGLLTLDVERNKLRLNP